MFDFRVNKSDVVNKLCKSEVKSSYQLNMDSERKLHFEISLFAVYECLEVMIANVSYIMLIMLIYSL